MSLYSNQIYYNQYMEGQNWFSIYPSYNIDNNNSIDNNTMITNEKDNLNQNK